MSVRARLIFWRATALVVAAAAISFWTFLAARVHANSLQITGTFSGSITLPTVLTLSGPPGCVFDETFTSTDAKVELTGQAGVFSMSYVLTSVVRSGSACLGSQSKGSVSIPLTVTGTNFSGSHTSFGTWTMNGSRVDPSTVAGTLTRTQTTQPNPPFHPGSISTGSTQFSLSACDVTLDPESAEFDGAGGGKTASVTAAQTCHWAATTDETWIHVTAPGTGQGNGSFSYTVDLNPTADIREGSISVGPKTFQVSQSPLSVTIVDPNPTLVSSNGTLIDSPGQAATLTSFRAGTVADGVAKLLFVVESEQPLSFALATGLPTDGTLSALNGGPATAIQPVNVGGRMIVVAAYTPPRAFGGIGFARSLAVSVSAADPLVAKEVAFSLERPPLVLMHGFNSDRSTWSSGFRQVLESQGYELFLGNYAGDNLVGFNPNSPNRPGVKALKDKINEARSKFLGRQIAIAQVDVLGHSMGGLLARTLMQSGGYRQTRNYHQGEIHRLVTLGTPHDGSPLPNIQPLLTWLVARNKQWTSFLDLAAGSNAVCSLAGSPAGAEVHAIVGSWSPGASTSKTALNLALVAAGQVLGQPFINLDTLHGSSQHDLLVPANSQEGGLGGAAVSTFGSLIHAPIIPFASDPHETASTQVASKVATVLNDPTGSFFGSLPAASCDQARPTAPAISIAPTSPTGGLEFVTPASGANVPYEPGSTISIAVNPAPGVNPTTVFFILDGLGMIEVAPTAPYTANVPLPQDVPFGPMLITAVGTDAVGGVFTAETSVNITLPTPVSVDVTLSSSVYTAAFPRGTFSVTGQFQWGAEVIERDMTSSCVYTAQKGSAVVTTDALGLVTAVARGSDVITATCGTFSEGFPVESKLPAAGEMLQNGSFEDGFTGWQTYATPSVPYFVGSPENGILRFYRQPGPGGSSNQATVFQQTGMSVPANTSLSASFDLANSSSVRKRISVLMLAHDFSDLSVCTFWLPAHAATRTYAMRTHSLKPWANAALYFYAATAGFDGGYYELSNVSMVVDPQGPISETHCDDPLAPAVTSDPAGPELLTNGAFDSGTAGWSLFGQITSQVTNGTFEFYRPSATPDPAGVILQPTGTAVLAGEVLTAQFDLGNSSSARKRVTVLLHDLDFSDLSACTFWLEPGQGLTPHSIRSFATKPWANATLSIYAATVGDDTWTRLDNASLRKTPGTPTHGTDCVEPSQSTIQPPSNPRPPAAGRTGAHLSAKAPATETSALAAPGAGLTVVSSDGGVTTVLPAWVVDLREGNGLLVELKARPTGGRTRTLIQVSRDGEHWWTLSTIDPPMPDRITVDLSELTGELIYVRVIVQRTPD